jgi:hypothetical protein
MLHFSAHWSRRNEQADDAAITEAGQRWLRKLLQTDLQPVHTHCHYWRYASIRCDKHTECPPCYVDSDQQLAVIGAWCQGGRVEGAYLSAMALIERCFS